MSRDNEDKKSYCAGMAVTEAIQKRTKTYEHRIIWINDRISGFAEIETDANRNLHMPGTIIINEVKYRKE